MKFTILSLFLLLILSSCQEYSKIDKGVPLKYAKERKSKISDLNYKIHFNIPLIKADSILSQNNITFNLSERNGGIHLDFKESKDHILNCIVNGMKSNFIFVNEHIFIPEGELKIGTNLITIDFIAGNLSLNRNEEYLYTLLVPDRARTVFPVFDQPDLKANYELSLTIPEEWEAVANGARTSLAIIDGIKNITFEKTKPISTYLFAFAAGKFKVWTDESTGMSMYYRETDSIKVARNAADIFELHRSSLLWLEEYTGIPYPFKKFDFALIPTFQYGGMEHPGSIFYRESALFLNDSPSINQELRRASLIAHETAHMWFGDLVTMKWFNDVWLKEVFANFMAAKIMNPGFPEINHDLRFLLAHYPRAYSIDRSEGSHPIQQKLDNLQNAGTLYGAIIYQKAPIVMRNLESMVGAENFQKGLREYLNEFAYGNATWDDLIKILSPYSSQDLNQWNNDWVKKAGMPTINVASQDNSISINMESNIEGKVWPQHLSIKDDSDGQEKEIKIHFAVALQETILQIQPDNVFYNIDGRTYAYHNLDGVHLSNMLTEIDNHVDPLESASTWMMLQESFLRGNLPIQVYLEKLVLNLGKEDNPLLLSYLGSNFQTIFWKFLSDKEMVDIGNKAEDIILNRLVKEKNVSIKRTLYNTYTSIAITDAGILNMTNMWKDSLKGFNLQLSERDYERLAYEIAVRGKAGSNDLLEEQLNKMKNPDNIKRMKFILPALSQESEVRIQFFNSLKSLENRGTEPWVVQALSFLNHPLRSSHGEQFIRPSLELIEEIQETGDIFFPARWLGAALAGHSSEVAAQEVRDYLSQHPELSSNLKNKVLQASDMLFRAARLKN